MSTRDGHRRPNSHRGKNAPSLYRQHQREQRYMKHTVEERIEGHLTCQCKHPQVNPDALSTTCVTCTKEIT